MNTFPLPESRTEQLLADAKPTYTEAEARAEAERCLYCADAPCIKACPTSIDIPTFIKKIASGNVRGAARTILEQNMLGYSCARVCPVEVLCVGDCVYNGWHRAPIQIGRLQRFATETATREAARPIFSPKPRTKRRVALIGAGPASLACAAYLALEGHQAVVFEKRALPGGLNTTGIAPYKLHAEDAIHEVEWVHALGVEIRTGVEIGRDVTGSQLLADFDAVFLGVGLGADTRLGIPNEDGAGVFGATAWIEEMKLAKAGKSRLGRHASGSAGAWSTLGRVVVVGGGNTAIDIARECAMLGAEDVAMVYRRSPDAMSGYAHEMDAARKAGVRLLGNAVPVAVLRDGGKLRGIRIARTEGGKAVPGTEYELPCDFVGVAIGQSKLHTITTQFPGVELDAKGCIVIDPKTGRTGNPKVYSGGDCVNGGKEVVNAVADGRDAAREMHRLFTAQKS
jgi:glutamate synthase (NADPH/NADH) small chain